MQEIATNGSYGKPKPAPDSESPGSGDAATSEVRLELEGMTCAACAARIERGLNKLEGVEASVNLVTEQATVKVPPSVTVDDLVGAVRAAGYDARPGVPAEAGRVHDHDKP